MGSVSSKTALLVKLRMANLSIQASEQGSGAVPSRTYSTLSLRTNTESTAVPADLLHAPRAAHRSAQSSLQIAPLVQQPGDRMQPCPATRCAGLIARLAHRDNWRGC